MIRRWTIPRLVFSRRGRPAAGDGSTADERFHALVLPHLESAWNYARYLSRDAATAEDVVQEAFLRAFQARAECRGDGRAWLMAIVRNCWHDWLRVHRPERNGSERAHAEPVEEETPHSVLERSSDADYLRSVLSALPEPFRETLVLRELEELSYREIAAIAGVPIGTVMSRLARGRDMLATLLLGDGKRAISGSEP